MHASCMFTSCVVFRLLAHPFEAPALRFDVTHRGGTYVSGIMNVAISVPRGAIERKESIKLTCQYFNGDKTKIGLGSSASIVSSVYKLSSSSSQSSFKKRVQITIPHGLLLQKLGEMFQLKVVIAQTKGDESEVLCWKPVDSKYCAFAHGFAVIRVNHFSLLALIFEKIHAGIELIQRTLGTSGETAEATVSSESEV